MVLYTGTPVNDTLRGCWQSAKARDRRYAGTYLASPVCGMNTPDALGDANWTWCFDWPMVGQ